MKGRPDVSACNQLASGHEGQDRSQWAKAEREGGCVHMPAYELNTEAFPLLPESQTGAHQGRLCICPPRQSVSLFSPFPSLLADIMFNAVKMSHLFCAAIPQLLTNFSLDDVRAYFLSLLGQPKDM